MINEIKRNISSGGKKTVLLRGTIAIIFVLTALTLVFSIKTNNSGFQSVSQDIFGNMIIKTSPGVYFSLYGKTTKYRTADTVYQSKWPDEGGKTDESIDVRFTGGELGYISVNVRYRLPGERDKMLLIHETFRNDQALKLAVIEQASLQATQLTASMMTAEDSYRNRRPQFTAMVADQIIGGLYLTAMSTTIVDGETIVIQEIIKDSSGQPMRRSRDMETYGIIITEVAVSDIEYEGPVVEQISRKREASMETELAKIESEKARQANIQAEEEGKRNVTIARYAEEENKIREVTVAQKEKEVAEMAAERELAVAEIEKHRAQVEVETAQLIKKATIAKAEGEAEAKRLVLQADGALEQKLQALVDVNGVWATAYTKQRPTPDIVIGGSDTEIGTSAQGFMDLIMIKTLQDLSLSLEVK